MTDTNIYIEHFDTPEGTDAQCSGCGGDVDWEDCWRCGGEGGSDEHEDDPVNFAPDECWNTCRECDGKGGWNFCTTCKKYLSEKPKPDEHVSQLSRR